MDDDIPGIANGILPKIITKAKPFFTEWNRVSVTAEKQRAALPPECGALNLQAFFIRSAERNGAGTPLPAQPSAACMRTVQEQEQAP